MIWQQSQPNRRRRKLILAFVVLVSLVLAWWNWPRGDARFVGKWELWKPGMKLPASYMAFHRNGMMLCSDHKDLERGSWIPWQAKGSTLTMGYEVGSLGNLTDSLNATVHRYTGWWPLALSPGRFEIRQIDVDSFEIRLDQDNIFTLRRIPE